MDLSEDLVLIPYFEYLCPKWGYFANIWPRPSHHRIKTLLNRMDVTVYALTSLYEVLCK